MVPADAPEDPTVVDASEALGAAWVADEAAAPVAGAGWVDTADDPVLEAGAGVVVTSTTGATVAEDEPADVVLVLLVHPTNITAAIAVITSVFILYPFILEFGLLDRTSGTALRQNRDPFLRSLSTGFLESLYVPDRFA